jgi:hypothetical protein
MLNIQQTGNDGAVTLLEYLFPRKFFGIKIKFIVTAEVEMKSIIHSHKSKNL